MSPMAGATEATAKTPRRCRASFARAWLASACAYVGEHAGSRRRIARSRKERGDRLQDPRSPRRSDRQRVEARVFAVRPGRRREDAWSCRERHFASKLEANIRGRPLTIDALGPLKEKLEAPRARARWPDNGQSMFVSLAPPRGQPSAQHRMPARAAEPTAALRQEALPPATHTAAVIGNYGIPTTSQRKLNIRKFDGTELYKGLGSGFFDWGHTFMLAVSLAEALCDFLLMEDVKVDILGHFLSGTAERYDHKQVNIWWVQQPRLEHVMEQPHLTFKTTITASQPMKLFMTEKEARRAGPSTFFIWWLSV